MKQELLTKIEFEISLLSDKDIEGHLWWHRFKTMVEQLPESTTKN